MRLRRPVLAENKRASDLVARPIPSLSEFDSRFLGTDRAVQGYFRGRVTRGRGDAVE